MPNPAAAEAPSGDRRQKPGVPAPGFVVGRTADDACSHAGSLVIPPAELLDVPRRIPARELIEHR